MNRSIIECAAADDGALVIDAPGNFTFGTKKEYHTARRDIFTHNALETLERPHNDASTLVIDAPGNFTLKGTKSHKYKEFPVSSTRTPTPY